jgi:hypothetical protein
MLHTKWKGGKADVTRMESTGVVPDLAVTISDKIGVGVTVVGHKARDDSVKPVQHSSVSSVYLGVNLAQRAADAFTRSQSPRAISKRKSVRRQASASAGHQ